MRVLLLMKSGLLRGSLLSFLILGSLACSLLEDDTGGGDTVTISFTEIDDVLPNPYKGFVPWVGEVNHVYDTKLRYGAYTWKNIEPVKGQYDWNHFEKNWPNTELTGRRVGFRISMAYPHSGEVDIPQWLVDEGVALEHYEIDGMEGLAPDWDDPNFLAAHRDLLLALGDRYDSDPRVAWIDIGSYGFWGEWHVWRNEGIAATQATKQSILEDYFDAFPTKPMVIAFDDDFATQYVVDRGGGIRNDCLGTSDGNDWYLTSVGDLSSTVWQTAIITGEFCGGTQGAIAGTTVRFDLNFDFIRATHWSFIGPAGGGMSVQSDEHRANMDEIHKLLGYRFILSGVTYPKEVALGEVFNFQLTVKNMGVAPFYLDWPLVLHFVDTATGESHEQALNADIRLWLPGNSEEEIVVDLPDDLSAGKYDLRIAIHDPDTGEPGILFANEGKDDEDRYQLGEIRIVD